MAAMVNGVRGAFMFMLGVAVFMSFMFWDDFSIPYQTLSFSSNITKANENFRRAPPPPPPPPQDRLGRILAKSATQNKTVIVSALNAAWAVNGSMMDMFLESFHVGKGTQELLNSVVIVCMDAKSYNRCIEVHGNCHDLPTPGVDFSGEKEYMSHDYLRMMWTRLKFLSQVLRRGYSLIFSDTDILWLKTPLEKLEEDEEADISISSDKFSGDPRNRTANEANTGFIYARSNPRTNAFFKRWYTSRRKYPGLKEQDVLIVLKSSNNFTRYGLKMRFLDTKHFGGFCQRSAVIEDAYTMHANCCKGLKAKLIDLRNVLHTWYLYSRHVNNSNADRWEPPHACPQSWLT